MIITLGILSPSSSPSVQNKFTNFTNQPSSKKVKKFDDGDDDGDKIPTGNDTNTGKVNNGIVSFEQDDHLEKQVKKKAVYHSSSEDEEVSKTDVIENKQKKNKIDIHSSEHKEKLRQRFLERQKLTQSIDDKPAKEIKTKKNNKYYEGSSDEEDEVQEKPTEIANK